ncbi:MAG: MATE family efflux transporter [Clostridiales bacterium]|nr:MATE family efflux transporter [Clostridiales bacterium]
MTEGNIFKHMITFALPLLMGNLFQQLYNMVDAWVVGNYVSNEAFSAVGTVGPILNMLIGAFGGLASGAGVVISQYYGAKNKEKVQQAVHNAVMLALVLAVAFTIIGVSMVPLMLRLIKTPEEVMPHSSAYLTIYFSGLAGLVLYNMGSNILRAVGDSRRPFIFLVVAAITNTVLDLVFVLVFHMGVEGVAWATIISQGISATLTIITLLRTNSWIKVRIRKIRFHMEMLKKTIKVGIPAALQMAVTAFANVFAQSYINQFGADCMGGYTAYHKIDQLIFLPMQSLSLTCTTFVGQNLGRGQMDRAKKGVSVAIGISVVVTLIISALVIAFAPHLVAFFNDKPEVIDYGTQLLRWLTPFYVLCCFNQIYAGAQRGAGNSKVPMYIMLSSFVVFRQIYLFVVSNFIVNELIPLAMGYPAGWLLCSVLSILYYRKAQLGNKMLVSSSEIKDQKS